LIVGIRPEHLTLAAADAAGFKVDVAAVETTGAVTFVTTATTPEIVIALNGRSVVVAGETIRLTFSGDDVHLFDAETEQRLK
jgi:multiple sugar transport system ATP-binding protein